MLSPFSRAVSFMHSVSLSSSCSADEMCAQQKIKEGRGFENASVEDVLLFTAVKQNANLLTQKKKRFWSLLLRYVYFLIPASAIGSNRIFE